MTKLIRRRRAAAAVTTLAAAAGALALLAQPAAAVISVARPGGAVAVANTNGTGLTVVGRGLGPGAESIMAPGGGAVLVGTNFGSPAEKLVLLRGTTPVRTTTLPCNGVNGQFSANGRELWCAGSPPGSFTQVAHRIDVASGAERPLPPNTTSTCAWSPDSARLACVRVDPLSSVATGVVVVTVATGGARVFAPGGSFVFGLAFSPDGGTLAFIAGGKLTAISTATGAQRVIAAGVSFAGFAFSPDSRRIAYITGANSRGAGTLTIETVATGAKRRLAGRRVDSFLYGRHEIVVGLRRFFPQSQTLSNQVANIGVVREDGTGFRQLTHVKRQRLPRIGLIAQFLSGDGRRLVAVFGGDDLQEAYAVDVVRGGARRIAHGALRATLFSKDGRFIYGDTASHTGEEPMPSRNNVIRVAWTAGARPHILVRHADLPQFSFGNGIRLVARRAP